MAKVDPAAWIPTGIADLEDAAWDVVRSNANSAVTAGPGSGKTELLAQRALFLLQTGVCENPRRILALSFKRDAATNLRERLSLRTDRSGGQRFDSFTFDAFSKGLLERFRIGLNEALRPAADFEI